MKAFITGISGFTGKHLVQLLVNKGIGVDGIDLSVAKAGVGKTKYISCNLTDKEKLTKIILTSKPDYVFHLASPIIRSDKLLDKTLAKNLSVDLFGTVNLLQAIDKLPKKPKVLITSTAAVYKKDKGQPFKETDKLEPRTAYGLSKLTQEMIGLQLAKSYDIPLIVSRSILLIGTEQAEGFVINDLVKQVAEIEAKMGKPVLWVGDLSTKRDFTDIRDGVEAYLTLLEKGKSGEIYNVCNGQAVTIKQVADWLKQNSRVKFEVKEKKQWRKNDLNVLVGDNHKLRELGWKPKYTLKNSLQEILDYWRVNLQGETLKV
ncbi:GDP-mannose 4,6-dehydratase [Patescibacteria group bacterium]